MAFVLDSSVALAMLLPDEGSAAADAIAELFERTHALVPAIWPLEVRNALLVAMRSRRLAPREFDERVSSLDALPIEVDAAAGREALSRTVEIARRHDLTVYDASYLELAQRHGIQLATLDGALRKACARSKIRALP